jgi:hypothetical protein
MNNSIFNIWHEYERRKHFIDLTSRTQTEYELRLSALIQELGL